MPTTILCIKIVKSYFENIEDNQCTVILFDCQRIQLSCLILIIIIMTIATRSITRLTIAKLTQKELCVFLRGLIFLTDYYEEFTAKYVV